MKEDDLPDFFKKKEKRVKVKAESELLKVAQNYDYEFDGSSTFQIPEFYLPNEAWDIGLIVGHSGSGKTTLLEENFKVSRPRDWDDSRAIYSQIEDAEKRLCGVGLSSIPSWFKPYHVLSNGERFRADLARDLGSNNAFDEFTSVVDRDVAKSASHGIQRLIRSEGWRNIVFASCHYDIIDFLKPTWIFDASEGKMLPRGRLSPVEFKLEVHRCKWTEWEYFRKHHYLSEKINKSARCWIATLNGKKIGFSSSIAFPVGTIKNAWREHRTVVLPEFQGCGIGVRLSDAIAEIHVKDGLRYFSKTSHPRMGEYRNRSPKWRGTSKNGKARPDYKNNRCAKQSSSQAERHANRICFSHEFISYPSRTSR